MTIEDIALMPTLFIDAEKGKSHESVLRAYHILEKAQEMLERGDSNKTVLEVISYLMNIHQPTKSS